jgi:hypothetical protein
LPVIQLEQNPRIQPREDGGAGGMDAGEEAEAAGEAGSGKMFDFFFRACLFGNGR